MSNTETAVGSSIPSSIAAAASEWSLELEKQLRLSRPGAAVEAVLRIGLRLRRWGMKSMTCASPSPSFPSSTSTSFDPPVDEPALANSLLLKLGDLFQNGSNEIRSAVLHAFLQHLEGQQALEDLADVAFLNGAASFQEASSIADETKACRGFVSRASRGAASEFSESEVNEGAELSGRDGETEREGEGDKEEDAMDRRKKRKRGGGLLDAERLLNPGLLLKRVQAVMDGPDVTARALSLHMIGCMAHVSRDSLALTSLVLEALDSTHDSESHAASFACRFLAPSSPKFAELALDRIASLACDASTPLPRWRRAVCLLSHMDASYRTALAAHKVPLRLTPVLSSYSLSTPGLLSFCRFF